MVTPWGVYEFVVSHPELGWILLFFWLLFELRSPRGRIYQLDKKITSSIIVIRALAKKEEAINEDKVDKYLVENGMEPDDFFKGDDMDDVEDDYPLNKPSKSSHTNIPNNDERSTK